MLLKSFALLFLAVALVAAQDAAEQPATRTRTAANRRTKLFEESQATQAEKVTAAGQRRRLVSKTKVSAAAKAAATTTTTVPTTTTTEAVVVTEPVFQEPEPAVEEQQSAEVEQEQPALPAFRPRPAAVPARTVTQEVQSELPAFRPRSRPAGRPVIVDEPEEEEVVPTARPRPVAGPTRARAQAAPAAVSRPQIQVQVAEEAPVRLSVDGKLPRTRTSVASEQTKQAPVETVRRYSFENEDGSFTFGYENADGSFKEETRGVDCIVRGKYGYVDPDGIKREFTYQTGNQCVPGQNNNEEEQEADEDDEEERPAPVRRPNVPARRPNIPTERRPNVPAVERRPVNVAQVQDEEEEISQVLSTPTRITRPTNTGSTQQRAPAPRPQEPQPAPRPRPAPVQQIVDFDSEVGRFQQPEAQQRPRPAAPPARPIFSDDDDHDVFVERRPAPPARTGTGLRSFSTELVFDRNTNQFQSALEQRIPETNEEVSIRERLIAFNPFTSTTPAPLLPRVPQTQTVQRPQQVQQTVQQRPQNEFNFNSPTLNDQERLRQLQEFRRAETEQQRLKEERERIAEQNRQAQNTPAVTFGAPPRTPQVFQVPQTTQQFRAPQPQPQFQFRPVGADGASSFATGQIDSFLTSLG